MPSELLAQNDDTEPQILYYHKVVACAKATSVEVQLDIAGKGKGVVATRDISEGETVFVERPLVHLQHLDNYGSALVCQACLRFVGSIERQIGHKLQSLVDQLRGTQPGAAHTADEGNCVDDSSEVDLDGALEAGERLEQIYSNVTSEHIAELRSETVTLPLSNEFKLAKPVPCRRGCGAVYCGAACEAEAWERSHCLLCPGQGPGTAATAGPGSELSSAAADTWAPAEAAAEAGPSSKAPGPSAACGSSSGGSRHGSDAGPSATAEAVTEELYGIHVDRNALAAFRNHAQETNEIFLLAAEVVAATLLRAAKLLLADGVESAAAVANGAGPRQGQQQQQQQEEEEEAAVRRFSAHDSSIDAHRLALLAAWQPYVYGWKRCWWESVAVPDDVDDEEEFRAQLRSLAADSLELLSAAISDPRFAPDLLQLEVYGSIVGMFELNNMGLTVSSPVEDYFLAVDDLEEGPEKRAVMKETQPLLDALDSEYGTPCEATAFLALQSCINHSCDPNCTATCDNGDCTVTVLAARDIPAGEEITLSYIDVSLPYKERQAELRDYGFVCRCARCVADAAAARARRQGVGSRGVKVGRRR